MLIFISRRKKYLVLQTKKCYLPCIVDVVLDDRDFEKRHGVDKLDNFHIPEQENCTGKSLSEALIFASTNPKYDDRLFIEL